jgi:CRISPR system Cascade subunit CasA
MKSFNLADEPWIPCLMLDGSRGQLSLREVFCKARGIREVYDSSPLVTVAVHRFLLAVLHSVFGPDTSKAWLSLWQQGSWDIDSIEKYLVKQRPRLDLFDPERPFGQVPRMADTGEKPIAALLLEAASGNNALLFDHGKVEGAEAISPARAACYLLAHQAFAIGFGKSAPFYLKDAPLTRGLTVLAYGNNLFETLALNLLPKTMWDGFDQKTADAPCWEREHLPEPQERGTQPLGRMDYLTWQSRRIHLIAREDGMIASCQIQQNYCLPDVAFRWDPFKRYRKDENGAWSAPGLVADKAVWQDCHSLLQFGTPAEARPALLNWLGEVDLFRQSGRIQARPQYHLVVFGLATAIGKAASVERWRAERLPLPLAYLTSEVLLDQLRRALELATEGGRALNRSIWFLAGQLVKKDDVEPMVRHLAAENLYWPHLAEPFYDLLRKLPEVPEDQVFGAWTRLLRHQAWTAFREVQQELETSAGVIKALTRAEGFFVTELTTALGKERGYESAD